MKKPITVLMVAVVLMVAAGVASATEFGTREQAKAMFERAIARFRNRPGDGPIRDVQRGPCVV